MTTGKRELIANLREVFGRWQTLLAERTDEEIATPFASGGWAVRDVIAHLMAWQQISIAHLEAALANSVPEYPQWLGGTHPLEAEERRNEFNARIYERYRDLPWSRVHEKWTTGFGRFLELAEELRDEDLSDAGRAPWLKGYSLRDVLLGSWEHHREHFDSVRTRLP